jgi:hypothetical protein
MRINELLIENQQIDELSLAGVGKGVGNVIRGTSTAIQGAKGAWQGAKDAWQQGKDSGTYDKARAAVSGIPANTAAPVGSQGVPTQQPAGQQAPAASPTPAGSTGAAPVAGATQVAPTTEPATAPTGSTAPAAPARTPTYSSKTAKTEVDKVISNIQQIRSRDRAGVVQYAQQKLATVKENVGVYSSFLGKEI